MLERKTTAGKDTSKILLLKVSLLCNNCTWCRAFTFRFSVRLVQLPKLDPISDREWACWIVGNLVLRLGSSSGTTQGPTSDWRRSGGVNAEKLSSVSASSPHHMTSFQSPTPHSLHYGDSPSDPSPNSHSHYPTEPFNSPSAEYQQQQQQKALM